MVALGASPVLLFGEPWHYMLMPLQAVMGMVGVAAAVLAVALPGWHRARYAAALASVLLLLAVLRWVAPYPYGHLKVTSLAAFVLVIGVAHAAVRLWYAGPGLARAAAAYWRWLGPSTPRAPAAGRVRAWRLAVVGAGAGAIAVLASGAAMPPAYFIRLPSAALAPVWDVQELPGLLPPQAVVAVPSDFLTPQQNGLLAYFLLQHPLVGRFHTVYGALERPGDADYLLAPAAAAAPPNAVGADPVWQNSVLRVYRLTAR